MADVEQSLEPPKPPADGAKAQKPPQQPANAAQALVPPVSTQPTEADLLAAVPKQPKRTLRRSRAGIESQPATIGVTESQPTVIESQPIVPGTPVPENPPPVEKKKPQNRKGQIGALLESDDEKENGGANANMSMVANAGLLAKSK